MRKPYDHFAYMEHLSQTIPGIRAYVPTTDWKNLTQLLATLNDIQTPCLVADYDYAADIIDRGSDNYLLRTQYSAMVFHTAPPGHAQQIAQVLALSRSLVDQIIAHLLQDHRAGRHGLAHMDVNSILMETLSPLADHALGIGFAYSILSPLPA